MAGLNTRSEVASALRRSSSKTSVSKGEEGEGPKQWYTLVKLDEDGGPGHVVSDEELRELEELILSEPEQTRTSEASEDAPSEDAPSEDTTGPLRLQLPSYQKPGGPCDHCGAVDSPQWRRGPASKPMLCNACGTRYRRTNNLGPPTPPVGRAALVAKNKRPSPPHSPTTTLNVAKKARFGGFGHESHLARPVAAR